MSSKKKHQEKGAKAAVSEYMIACAELGSQPSIAEAIFYSWWGSHLATLPDIVDDPGGGPTHRGFANSREVFAILQQAYQNAKTTGRVGERVFLRAMLSHFEEDAMTPAGLPTALEIVLRRLLGAS